jgi:hypothetical protein
LKSNSRFYETGSDFAAAAGSLNEVIGDASMYFR